MKEVLEQLKDEVEKALEEIVPPESTHPGRLVSAMRYSLLGGGKRIRPVLTLAAAQACGGRIQDAMFAACAVELVHTYSLIHDDLPAMDDDDFRRGRPTCHRAFDEATAILAGDALLTMAFGLLSDKTIAPGVPADTRNRMVSELAAAAGWKGMVGGQQADMDSEGENPSQPVLEYIHIHKTGAMIRCSVLLGALAASADAEELSALERYGEKIGLAFQVVDDILDVTATTEEMGKDQGSDAARGKMTFPALFGLEETRQRAKDLIEDAKAALQSLGGSDVLIQIADYVLLRRL